MLLRGRGPELASRRPKLAAPMTSALAAARGAREHLKPPRDDDHKRRDQRQRLPRAGIVSFRYQFDGDVASNMDIKHLTGVSEAAASSHEIGVASRRREEVV